MAYTISTFIRKNTPELRKRLEDLGYRSISSIMSFNGIKINEDNINGLYRICYFNDMIIECINNENECIDCGTNERLFLAIAALRDDSNASQYFIADTDLDVYYKDGRFNHKIKAGEWFYPTQKWWDMLDVIGTYHKMTIDELKKFLSYEKNKEK